MAVTITTLNPSLKPSLNPFKPYNASTSPLPSNRIITPQSFNSRNCCNHAFPLLIPSRKNLGFPFFGSSSCSSRNNYNSNNLGFALKPQNAGAGGVEGGVSKAEKEAFGSSTKPERFNITSVPSPPVLWPYLLALPFLIYVWRTVVWEVGQWRKLAAYLFSYIAVPVAFLIRCIETALYAIRAVYSGIVAYAPVTDLTLIIVLSSIVLAIAETVVPDAINSQPYVLTVAGVVGFAAVRGFISEPFFYALLLSLVGFSRFIKKRDYVSSSLPAAAVLAAIGKPWVRFIVIICYLAVAIIHHSNKPSEEKEPEATSRGNRVPFPLLWAALAIGVHVAAKWAGYRHLTWMIV